MYPFLRRYAGNPGYQEGFLGKVDDFISARTYLKKLDYVDTKKIYFGVHSTVCLVLLVSMLTGAANDS